MSATASSPASEQSPRSAWNWRSFGIRFGVTACALVIWFWTQSLIGSRGQSNAAIADRMHQFTAYLNSYLQLHTTVANGLLIVSSAIIDLLGIFLLSRWLFGACVRPFLALVIVLGLRQIMQALVALPTPPNAIWHYPGFPSLLVTYGVSNDYFFSGHTAIAVLGAAELARFARRWLTALGVSFVIFEVATVLVLRAHYTMDVFTGGVTGLCSFYLAEYMSRGITQNQSAVVQQ